ncbi:NGFI-A-binding protein 1-like isoform X2 [Ostrea edulis]|uniref:NGFI-A-binding protein 1-like isoform X2 n=1 Tax=Ostrea edulis TaxID=37623 RepID=UPI0024AEDEA8|nr:NGFI-A-binding protein 1-like isoform X2 [Ostrea edulis]XP_055995873.1 NGFI-A-binding protein 1-like isoform X2 [Ostrea edulis]
MSSIQPGNTSEWQLYRVLQRSNLLQYYDTFIAQGGDDVQQLCEAGEEEFLEIMALVGMASKPLHVRRLQKALQEFVQNPAAFQSSLPASSSHVSPQTITTPSSHLATMVTTVPKVELSQPVYPTVTMTTSSSSSSVGWAPSVSPGPATNNSNSSHESDSKDLCTEKQQLRPASSTSPTPTPILVESQINAIAQAAARLAKELPPFDMKKLNMKKPINKEIMQLINSSSEDEPNRMEHLRKYAAIYGRFDSKRKSEKPMSLHEISVNEAAAQLCRHMPTLLTRREDLFPLARQVVRDSGYQYSKGHSRLNDLMLSGVSGSSGGGKKKLDSGFLQMYVNLCESNPGMVKNPEDSEKMSRLMAELTVVTQNQEMLKAQLVTAKENNQTDLVNSLQTQIEQATASQLQLYTEQSELIRKQRRLTMGTAFDDDTGSDFPSGASSPNNSGDGEDFNQQIRQHLYASGELLKSKPAMQNTLFDEGMRIAQQFGLSDFAEELKGLADTSPEEESKGITDPVKRKANSTNDSENGDLDTEETCKKLRLEVNGQEEEEEEEEEDS